MLRAEAIKRQITSDLGDEPIADACLKIIDFIQGKETRRDLSLTFSHLAQILKLRGPDTGFLLVVANVLTSDRVSVLKPELLFLGDDGPETLDDQFLNDYRESGTLTDPKSGTFVDNPESRLVPIFHASPGWLNGEVNE